MKPHFYQALYKDVFCDDTAEVLVVANTNEELKKDTIVIIPLFDNIVTASIKKPVSALDAFSHPEQFSEPAPLPGFPAEKYEQTYKIPLQSKQKSQTETKSLWLHKFPERQSKNLPPGETDCILPEPEKAQSRKWRFRSAFLTDGFSA